MTALREPVDDRLEIPERRKVQRRKHDLHARPPGNHSQVLAVAAGVDEELQEIGDLLEPSSCWFSTSRRTRGNPEVETLGHDELWRQPMPGHEVADGRRRVVVQVMRRPDEVRVGAHQQPRRGIVVRHVEEQDAARREQTAGRLHRATGSSRCSTTSNSATASNDPGAKPARSSATVRRSRPRARPNSIADGLRSMPIASQPGAFAASTTNPVLQPTSRNRGALATGAQELRHQPDALGRRSATLDTRGS